MKKQIIMLALAMPFVSANAQENRRHCEDTCKLEAELEMYPLNLLSPKDPVIKSEAMFSYHDYDKNDHLFNIRFFADANTHWDKERDLSNLIMYSEVIYGFKYFQIGFETGSVTGKEYLGIGLNSTTYDNKIFKRVALITRFFPDYVTGYEYTTRELKVFPGVFVSSTGTSRIILFKNGWQPEFKKTPQMVIQASFWISFEKIPNVFIGGEYEFNNADFYNNRHLETVHDVFLGIRYDMR